MRVELIPLEGGEPVRLVNAVSVIGRLQQTCNVCLPQSGVSKQHCVIRQTERSVLLRDLGSTNGTRINRKQVEGEQELHTDDVLALGNSEFRVQIHFDATETNEDAPSVEKPPFDEPETTAEFEPQTTDGESHEGSSRKQTRDDPRRHGAKSRRGPRGERISEAQVLAILNEGGGDDDQPQLPQLQVKHEPQDAPTEPASEAPPPPPKRQSALFRRNVAAQIPEESPQSATGAAANEALGADRAQHARRLLVANEEPAPERRSLRELLEPVLKDRFTLIAVAAALVALLVFWPWGGSASGYYKTYETIWADLKELRETNAGQKQWQDFRQRKLAELEPLVKELEDIARSNKPLLQELLFAGRDLKTMLDDARTEESKSELAFIEHMQLARRMMDAGDPQRIQIEWSREQQEQRQRKAQATKADGEDDAT